MPDRSPFPARGIAQKAGLRSGAAPLCFMWGGHSLMTFPDLSFRAKRGVCFLLPHNSRFLAPETRRSE